MVNRNNINSKILVWFTIINAKSYIVVEPNHHCPLKNSSHEKKSALL